MMSLDCLSNEILLEILLNVHDIQTINKFSLTCKKYHYIVNDPYINKKILSNISIKFHIYNIKNLHERRCEYHKIFVFVHLNMEFINIYKQKRPKAVLRGRNNDYIAYTNFDIKCNTVLKYIKKYSNAMIIENNNFVSLSHIYAIYVKT